ncbi:transposase [Deinococcus oregonensis]|uniref:Transposase n=1 Tax=Deinococcus oregonensis TaxID=1805970 RepID=A0ABV6B2R5_9DEIO
MSDAPWERLEPLLPPLAGGGRPYLKHQRMVSGVLRTGAPWRNVLESFGKWTTMASRFHRWLPKGSWQQV